MARAGRQATCPCGPFRSPEGRFPREITTCYDLGMPRKVIIDCDPGIDDAVALAMALFDPRLEVLAVTACGGKIGRAHV